VAIHQHQLSNGLCIIVEEMDHVESASYDLLIPGGLVFDEDEHIGASIVLAELIAKGAGQLDSRALSDAFDSAGIRHGEGVGMDRFTLSGSLVASSIDRALELVVSMVRRPFLPEKDIEPIQSILLQDLEALKDNPARRSMVELSKRFYPQPFNRSSLGDARGIQSVNGTLMQQMHARFFQPEGAILSIAGKVDSRRIFATVDELFGDWQGRAATMPTFGVRPQHEYFHIQEQSAQSQIVLAAPSVKFSDDLYYEGKLVASILGSSMFGRLFIEVREKRGLCYSVFARHSSTNLYGTMSAYVGTTPERAQESADVLLGELQSLPGTITQEELDRSRTNLKASLIMGEESPGSRAGSNANDWWLLRRVRGLSEIQAGIDAVSLDSIEEFLRRYPFKPCSLLTLGSASLSVGDDVVGRRG
jgi:predicted Zn-dependent peptidase